MNDEEIHVRVEPHKREAVICGDCGGIHDKGYHGSDEVVVEDLSLGKRRLYLHVIKRKNSGPKTGRKATEGMAWLDKWKRVTRRFAIQINRWTSLTTNQEAGWFLGMNDEKGRTSEVLNKYYESLGQENCERIGSVSLDGAKTYSSPSREYAVNAFIVLDRFHATQKVNNAVDQVRKNELRKARKNEDEELIQLTNCQQRFLLLKNKTKRTDRQSATLSRLCDINQPIYTGMILKEKFLEVYD